jgi:acyl-CoA thioesterase-2
MPGHFNDLMTLEQIGAELFLAEPPGGGFLYGGLTMALALAATAATVEPGLVPMSIRCSFLTFGEWGRTEVAVAPVSTTRRFANRRFDSRQRRDGREVLVAAGDVAFHRHEQGTDRHDPLPSGITRSDDLEAVQARFGSAGSMEPFEVRPLTPVPWRRPERFHPFWARAREGIGDDETMHAAALAFMSDYRVIHAPFEPGSGEGEGFESFTLEHTLWFHRSITADRWMLFDCDPLTQSNGRYVARGTVHDEGGSLLASFVQEGFVRPARPR